MKIKVLLSFFEAVMYSFISYISTFHHNLGEESVENQTCKGMTNPIVFFIT